MIYPDISVVEFKKKYPGMNKRKFRCCKTPTETDIPFISKEWAGILARCKVCGMDIGSSMVCRTKESLDKLSRIFNSIPAEEEN